jgi:hypothetical protein
VPEPTAIGLEIETTGLEHALGERPSKFKVSKPRLKVILKRKNCMTLVYISVVLRGSFFLEPKTIK